jgi:hypothetical protein
MKISLNIRNTKYVQIFSSFHPLLLLLLILLLLIYSYLAVITFCAVRCFIIIRFSLLFSKLLKLCFLMLSSYLFSCFVYVFYCVYSVFCVLFLPFVYIAVPFPTFLQFQRPLPRGGNPIAVNKYHISYVIALVADFTGSWQSVS